MKKFYFLILVFIAGFNLNAQVLISGFEFPGGVEEPFNANLGLENNLSYDIRMEDTDGAGEYSLYLKKGVGGDSDSAATCAGWDNAANYKMLSVKVKGSEYGHFTVSSQMRSTNNDPGPADWKVMWRQSGGEWADVPGSEFTIANDWTTGQLVDIAIPEAANNPESSLYIAWVPTSNLDMNGDEVTAAGTVKIDNIMIYGSDNTGLSELHLENNTKCFPNPATSNATITVDVDAISISTFDPSGRLVWDNNNPQQLNTMNVSDLSEGVYMIRVQYPNYMVTRKLIVK